MIPSLRIDGSYAGALGALGALGASVAEAAQAGADAEAIVEAAGKLLPHPRFY